MELYEFRYGLADLLPENGWDSVQLDSREQIETRINSRAFYDSIQIKPRVDDRIVLDAQIIRLSQMLFVGLVTGEYPPDWVNAHFYFRYPQFFLPAPHSHISPTRSWRILAGKPYRHFEQKQKQLELCQDVGYKAFREANAEVDQLFIQSVMKLIAKRGTPILLAIAGATAAGKTEIVERLGAAFLNEQVRKPPPSNWITSLPIGITGRPGHRLCRAKKPCTSILFKQALEDITHGKTISTPRYNFIDGSSSHDLDGRLKPGRLPVEVEPADIIFIEGNFPFLIEEILHLIGIKVVYLTDDPVRMKRKWKRDMDYRKKYDLSYFRNRYFKDQFIMAAVRLPASNGSLRYVCGYHRRSSLDNARNCENSQSRLKGYLMIGTSRLRSPLAFSEILFERMIPINAAIKKLALYEFRYALENLYPEAGWDSIELDKEEEIERAISQRDFYEAIQAKPREKDRIVLDESIVRLTRMLFAGLVRGDYNQAWVNKLFYFDVRGFYFLPRTIYFTEAGAGSFGRKTIPLFRAAAKAI